MILLTGPNSMIGRAVISSLSDNKIGFCPVYHDECNLESFDECYSRFEYCNADTLIHLAGYNGNIQFNLKNPTDIFYKTAQMGLNVLRCAEIFKYKKIIAILSSCAYPDLAGSMMEHQLWDGECNHTVSCHGYSKRMLDAYGQHLRSKGISYTSCIVQNSYGPFDSLDLNKTKVVTALIIRLLNAKKNNDNVICWGTGSPKREFIYSKDVGNAIVKCLYTDANRINIGSGEEISIKDLVIKIADIIGFTGEIIWDTTKEDGQNQKKLSLTLMQDLGLEITPLSQGLKETILWVESQL